MRPITFAEADLAAVAQERYHHPDPRVQRKMTVLWLKHHGETHERIAVLAGVSRSSVRRFLRRLGMAPRKVAAIPVPPKSSVEEHAKEQARFLEDELSPRLHAARAG